MSPQARRHGATAADDQAQAPGALLVALPGTQVPSRQDRAAVSATRMTAPVDQFPKPRPSGAPGVLQGLGRRARCAVGVQSDHYGTRRVRRRVVCVDHAKQVRGDEQPRTLPVTELDAVIAFSNPPPECTIDWRGRPGARGGDFPGTLRQRRRRLWQLRRRDGDQAGLRGDADRSAQSRHEKQPRDRRAECVGLAAAATITDVGMSPSEGRSATPGSPRQSCSPNPASSPDRAPGRLESSSEFRMDIRRK